MEKSLLPSIPAKRYFTIGEVSELCGVKAYVLRYWEQEFTQLKPMKRRGNRRYYQHHEVLLIRRIRELLYDQGFTISGARNRLVETPPAHAARGRAEPWADVPADDDAGPGAPFDGADGEGAGVDTGADRRAGARGVAGPVASGRAAERTPADFGAADRGAADRLEADRADAGRAALGERAGALAAADDVSIAQLRQELLSIRLLLTV